MFWILTPSWPYRLQIFYPIQQVALSCCRWFSFAEQKLLHLMKSPVFCFISLGSRDRSKNTAAMYVTECSAYVLLEEV